MAACNLKAGGKHRWNSQTMWDCEIHGMELRRRHQAGRVQARPMSPFRGMSADDRLIVAMEASNGLRSLDETMVGLLAEDDDEDIRAEVARSSLASASVLATLARDADPNVRAAVASNANIDRGTQTLLALDDETFVRAAIARNPLTFDDIVEGLRDDEHRWVRADAHQHPSNRGKPFTITTDDGEQIDVPNGRQDALEAAMNADQRPELLDVLSRHRDAKVRAAVGEHPSTPVHALYELSFDADEEVRTAVAENPNATDELFADLAADEAERVRDAVASNKAAHLTIREAAKIGIIAFFASRFGVAVDNDFARDLIGDERWWELGRGSQTIAQILAIAPNGQRHSRRSPYRSRRRRRYR